MISYEPLWKTMQDQNITTYALIEKHGLNPRTINNLKHNKSITMYTLEKLCNILKCQSESIVIFIPDKKMEN